RATYRRRHRHDGGEKRGKRMSDIQQTGSSASPATTSASPKATSAFPETWNHTMMNNYGTPRVEIVRGQGAYLEDSEGNKYLDLLAGIAVNALGHNHPAIVDAV